MGLWGVVSPEGPWEPGRRKSQYQSTVILKINYSFRGFGKAFRKHAFLAHFFPLFFFFFNFIYLFIYLWLCWVFVSARGLSPAAASGDHSSSRCAGLSLSRPLSLRSTGSRRAGSAIVAHGPSCSAARGIFPDQGSNPYPLHWQADSQPLCHQGSPLSSFLKNKINKKISPDLQSSCDTGMENT